MGKFLRALKTFWRGKARYSYPALDLTVGDRTFHLVGSIHMGTQGMMPLPATLLQRLDQADALIVEADITSGPSPFGESEKCPPLSERLTQDELTQFYRLCETVAVSPEAVAALPPWQIALMLQAQQAQRLGLRSEYGIDVQLLKAASARQRPVRELEGAHAQLALLQSLPDNGLALLRDTLEHWHTNARLLQTMVGWWLESPPRGSSALPSTFNGALDDVLMLQRNQRWREILLALPAGNYVVAVGALHLYGTGNLPDLLRKTEIRSA